MSNPRYSFISAYLKGEEAKLVTSEHIAKLTKSPEIDDVLTAIEGTDIGIFLSEYTFSSFDEIDGTLARYLGYCVTRIQAFRFIPDDVLIVLKAYTHRYDVLNIKSALQRLITGNKARIFPIGTIHDNALLDDLIMTDTIEGVVEVLDKCSLAEYSSIVKEFKAEDSNKSRFDIESQLDGAYYKNMFSTARKVQDGFILTKALGTIVDIMNLQTVTRAILSGAGMEAAGNIIPEGYLLPVSAAKELLPLKLNDLSGKIDYTSYRDIIDNVIADYGKNQSLMTVTETIEKQRLELLRGTLSPRIMSPLMIVWYMVLKEIEIRNLRLVFKAAFDDVPVEDIKEYLVYAS
ncbi:MAG: V-type ATPase subunit [Dehalococcoidia bacterium]